MQTESTSARKKAQTPKCKHKRTARLGGRGSCIPLHIVCLLCRRTLLVLPPSIEQMEDRS